MSPPHKRCIVKRLDFENCVVTNDKTKAKNMKKMRAKTSVKIENSFNVEKKRKFEESKSNSPILSQKCSTSTFRIEKSSPVLTKKEPKNLKSPIIVSKSKRAKRHEIESVKSKIEIVESDSSPIFKSKITPVSTVSSVNDVSDEVIEDDQDCKSLRISSFEQSQESSWDYQIKEAATQETEESSGAKIGTISDSSKEVKSSEELKISETSDLRTPVKKESSNEQDQDLDSGKKKKKFKKGSLSARLEILLKRQASERRIWEHEKEILKTDRKIVHDVFVKTFWKSGPNRFVLKCGRRPPESDPWDPDRDLVIIVDGDFIPEISKVQQGTCLAISPPWQEVQLPHLNVTVLLAVVCLEVKNEILKPSSHETVLESVNIENADDSFLINCFFKSL